MNTKHGHKILLGKPTCRREYTDPRHPYLRLFCDATLIPVERMSEDGYDDWLVKFRCPKCGREEWIHSTILPMRLGGMR